MGPAVSRAVVRSVYGDLSQLRQAGWEASLVLNTVEASTVPSGPTVATAHFEPEVAEAVVLTE
jgi:hypothetical protein